MSRLVVPICAGLLVAACFSDPEGVPLPAGGGAGAGGQAAEQRGTGEGAGPIVVASERPTNARPDPLVDRQCQSAERTTYRTHGPADAVECEMLTGVLTGRCGDLTSMAMSTGFVSFVYFYDTARALVGTREFTDDFSFCGGSSTRTWGRVPSGTDCPVWVDGAQACAGHEG